jgi:hypothetical protein
MVVVGCHNPLPRWQFRVPLPARKARRAWPDDQSKTVSVLLAQPANASVIPTIRAYRMNALPMMGVNIAIFLTAPLNEKMSGALTNVHL